MADILFVTACEDKHGRLGSTSGLLDEEVVTVRKTLQEILGRQVDSRTAGSLAGPNELLQFILDIPMWKALALWMAGTYGKEFVSHLGKKHAERLFSRKDADNAPADSQLKTMARALSEYRRKGNFTGFGLPKGNRNICVPITVDEPDQLLLRMGVFAKNATLIGRLVHGVFSFGARELRFNRWGRNPDMSDKIVIDDELRISFPVFAGDKETWWFSISHEDASRGDEERETDFVTGTLSSPGMTYEIGIDLVAKTAQQLQGAQLRELYPASSSKTNQMTPEQAQESRAQAAILRAREIIEISPDVRRGEPVIRGTDVLLREVLINLAVGESPDNVVSNFPALSEEQVRTIMAFAAATAGIPKLPSEEPKS